MHLSCDPASKFNRCRISIHFAFPAQRKTATAHALLPLVMERGYADCPDMTRLTKKLAKLYGADLTVDARPMGCNHNLCVSVTGIKDRFALEGEALTREYAALALGTAFHPYFVGGVFDPEAVTIEKQMLKKALEDEINEKRIYCQRQANREFFGSSPAGIRQEGYLDEVDGLTPETLTEAYREMLRTASIELLVLGCGEAETEQVKQALEALRRHCDIMRQRRNECCLQSARELEAIFPQFRTEQALEYARDSGVLYKSGIMQALRELDRVCRPGGRLIIPTYMNRTDKGTTNRVSGAIGKAGADFKREFTPDTYRQFFAEAGYPDAEYTLCEGRIPCAVAVLQKREEPA